MKITSINNINYNNNNVNFKRSAVPYPEYISAYNVVETPLEGKIAGTIEKLAKLFSPKVTSESVQIKKEIDAIYTLSDKKSASKKLLSVFA